MSPARPTVVLLSGGVDSTTALALARRDGCEVYALTFRGLSFALAFAEAVDSRDIVIGVNALGVDYGLTVSCYDPAPEGRPCRRCDACVLRRKGFEEARITDSAA